jgi:hypothetical protein
MAGTPAPRQAPRSRGPHAPLLSSRIGWRGPCDPAKLLARRGPTPRSAPRVLDDGDPCTSPSTSLAWAPRPASLLACWMAGTPAPRQARRSRGPHVRFAPRVLDGARPCTPPSSSLAGGPTPRFAPRVLAGGDRCTRQARRSREPTPRSAPRACRYTTGLGSDLDLLMREDRDLIPDTGDGHETRHD